MEKINRYPPWWVILITVCIAILSFPSTPDYQIFSLIGIIIGWNCGLHNYVVAQEVKYKPLKWYWMGYIFGLIGVFIFWTTRKIKSKVEIV